MKTGVYKITNQANDKMYVGSAIDLMNRWYKHKSQLNKNKHHSIKLQRAWNKYGVDNFKFEIIEECDKEKLIEIEQYYIDLYDSYCNGYNSNPTARNMLGFKHSEESKIKMSESAKGKQLSDETKERLRSMNIGRKRSKEFRLKISKTHKGRKNTDETKKKMSESFKGRKLSTETRNKISKANKGKVRSDASIINMRLAQSGRNNPAYSPTPILQYDLNDNFIKEWKDLVSLKEAGFINTSNISAVCRGNGKSIFGFKWKFKS